MKAKTRRAIIALCKMIDCGVKACHGTETTALDWACSESVGLQFQADEVRNLLKRERAMGQPRKPLPKASKERVWMAAYHRKFGNKETDRLKDDIKKNLMSIREEDLH